MKNKLLSSAFAISLVASSNFSFASENWPEPKVKDADAAELHERFVGRSGILHDDSYKKNLQTYNSKGDYLNWGKTANFVGRNEFVLDTNGLPQVKDGGKHYWNAVILSQYALSMYGKYIEGDKKSLNKFLTATDKLITLQANNGAFPYPSRVIRHNVLPDGWVSAMAQGQALSVFSRALAIKNDERYRKAGDLAFENLMTPVAQGGARSDMGGLDPSLTSYIFFPEYPNTPIDYTLNGYMFTLLGLYDWSQTKSSKNEEAEAAFTSGMKTLVKILPYYDISGLSSYDMAHIILDSAPYVAPNYLGIHVYLLHAINSVSPHQELKTYEDKWTSEINKINSSLRFTKIEVDSSPKIAGSKIKILLDTKGGDGSKKLYKIDVRKDNVWTTLSPYTDSNTIYWTPTEPGEYVLGFFTKNADSKEDYDNFRNQPFTVTKE